MAEFIMVDENKTFIFKNLCPYCSGDLTYHVNGWEQDDDGLWQADNIESECSNDPGIDSDTWEDWFQQHSDMPYANQLPVDEKVKSYINSKYRFKL